MKFVVVIRYLTDFFQIFIYLVLYYFLDVDNIFTDSNDYYIFSNLCVKLYVTIYSKFNLLEDYNIILIGTFNSILLKLCFDKVIKINNVSVDIKGKHKI